MKTLVLLTLLTIAQAKYYFFTQCPTQTKLTSLSLGDMSNAWYTISVDWGNPN